MNGEDLKNALRLVEQFCVERTEDGTLFNGCKDCPIYEWCYYNTSFHEYGMPYQWWTKKFL